MTWNLLFSTSCYVGKQSNLGRLQDEDELAEYKETIRKQQKEQEKLKKQHAKEVQILSLNTILRLSTS